MVAINERLFHGKTSFQEVEIFDTPGFGRCLFLDGKTQSTELDEFIYHESLVQPAMSMHPNPRSVFVAGGGEGATIREVLRHNTVERVVMVDIDQELVELCSKFLPNHHNGAFNDSRVDIKFQDARLSLEKSTETYDVIIIDLPDPHEGSPASLLYTRNFYTTVSKRLNPNGIMVVQSEPCMAGNLDAFSAINNTLRGVFKYTLAYHCMVPSFSSDWGFNLVSNDPVSVNPDPDNINRMLETRGCKPLRFYDGNTHQGLFTLPKYVRETLESETRTITEEKPLVVF
jgi:spermidine synthase